MLVLIGPHGIGNTQRYEYQLGLLRRTREPDFPPIPIVLPGTPPELLPRGFLAPETWADFADAPDPLRGGPPTSPDHLPESFPPASSPC